jgi:hypothetical protein
MQCPEVRFGKSWHVVVVVIVVLGVFWLATVL